MSCHLGHHQQWGKVLLRSRELASFRFWIQYRALDIDKPQREWNEGMSFKLLLQLPNLIVFGQQQAQVYQTYAQWGELWCALKRKKEKGEKWASQTKEGQQNKCWDQKQNESHFCCSICVLDCVYPKVYHSSQHKCNHYYYHDHHIGRPESMTMKYSSVCRPGANPHSLGHFKEDGHLKRMRSEEEEMASLAVQVAAKMSVRVWLRWRN